MVFSAADFQEDKFQSRAEDITLKDDVTSLNNMLSLNDFGGMGAVDHNEFGGMLEELEVQLGWLIMDINYTNYYHYNEYHNNV